MTEEPRKREFPVCIRVSGEDKEDSAGLVLHVLRPFCNVRWNLLGESMKRVSNESLSNVNVNDYRRCTSSGS